MNLKTSQLFFEFVYIQISNLKFLSAENQFIYFKYSFSIPSTLLPGGSHTTHPSPPAIPLF
jgi:hypothetical protein